MLQGVVFSFLFFSQESTVQAGGGQPQGDTPRDAVPESEAGGQQNGRSGQAPSQLSAAQQQGGATQAEAAAPSAGSKPAEPTLQSEVARAAAADPQSAGEVGHAGREGSLS